MGSEKREKQKKGDSTLENRGKTEWFGQQC
jgi:hypothetical protein